MEKEWIEWAREAREGDVAAFERIVQRFRRPLCSVVHPIVKDWHLAQDVAQETLVSAWNRLDELREVRSFRAWLFRIAHNQAVSRLRNLRCRPARTLENVRDEEIRGFPAGPRCELVPGPPEGRPSRAARARVRRLILRLPARYGTVLAMRHVEGMTLEEMAVALESSPASVKALLYRARIRARAALLSAGISREKWFHEL